MQKVEGRKPDGLKEVYYWINSLVVESQKQLFDKSDIFYNDNSLSAMPPNNKKKKFLRVNSFQNMQF